MERIDFLIPYNIKQELMDKARNEGLNLSEKIRELIYEELDVVGQI